MKQIVMLQGMGINERGWARLVSRFGRVLLIQQGVIQHVETWENGQCVFNGPETSVLSSRKLDELTFSSLTMLRSIARCRELLGDGKADVIIASNYSMGFAALLLRLFGKARRAVVFITDFMPPRGSFALRLHRRITAILTRLVARWSDEVWSISPRIPTAAANPRNFVVPICISGSQAPAGGARTEIGYIGFPSPDHALDVLFEIGHRRGIRLNIIGDSPYLQSIKHLAPPDTAFHGMLNNEEKIGNILSRCFCGYAIYRDITSSSYSYYGFPSKTLYCFASNVPVIITNVAHFNQNFEKFGVGRVVAPVPEEIEKAILQIKDHYDTYSRTIDRFRDEWNAGVETFHRERFAVLFDDARLRPESSRAGGVAHGL